MGKMRYFKANAAFRHFIQDLGFEEHVVNSNKQYFTNEIGKQIRIDPETGIISLLTEHGYIYKYSTTMTSKEIMDFIEE